MLTGFVPSPPIEVLLQTRGHLYRNARPSDRLRGNKRPRTSRRTAPRSSQARPTPRDRPPGIKSDCRGREAQELEDQRGVCVLIAERLPSGEERHRQIISRSEPKLSYKLGRGGLTSTAGGNAVSSPLAPAFPSPTIAQLAIFVWVFQQQRRNCACDGASHVDPW